MDRCSNMPHGPGPAATCDKAAGLPDWQRPQHGRGRAACVFAASNAEPRSHSSAVLGSLHERPGWAAALHGRRNKEPRAEAQVHRPAGDQTALHKCDAAATLQGGQPSVRSTARQAPPAALGVGGSLHVSCSSAGPPAGATAGAAPPGSAAASPGLQAARTSGQRAGEDEHLRPTSAASSSPTLPAGRAPIRQHARMQQARVGHAWHAADSASLCSGVARPAGRAGVRQRPRSRVHAR